MVGDILIVSTSHQKIGTQWSLKLVSMDKSSMESITVLHLEKSMTKLFSQVMISLAQSFQVHIQTHIILFQTTNFPILVAQEMTSLELFGYVILNGWKEDGSSGQNGGHAH